MLKITTSTANGFDLKSKTNYYIVYENGVAKKTSELLPSDVTSYCWIQNNGDAAIVVKNLDASTPEGEEVYKIVNNIVLLLDESKLNVIPGGKLFVLNKRYFVTVLCDNGKKPISDILFEYTPVDNCIKEIASFNSKSINHIELYDS